MRLFTILLISNLTLGAQQPPSQTPASAREDVVFSVTTTLVQIDAVVLDGKGRQVTNLGPADFEVLIDGKPQTITNFSYVNVTPDGVQPQQRITGRQPSNPTAALLPPHTELKREDVRRTIVLMVDDLGLSAESMVFTRRALHRFVERQMQPGDLVAVCRTAAGSGALQTFTTDKRILTSVIDHLRWYPDGRGGLGLYSSLGLTSPGLHNDAGNVIGDTPNARPRGFDRWRDADSQVGTLVAVQHVVNALRELPGRKSVVLFSDGISLFVAPGGGHHDRLPEMANDVIAALNALADRANRSGTVLYTMDVRGLQPLMLDASYNLPVAELSLRNAGPRTVSNILQEQTQALDAQFNSSQQGLESIADLTGGLAYQNGNDLNYGLERVLEDQKGYYLLGFHPDHDVFTISHGEPRFNRVKVKVHGAGLHVRSRTGFFGETDEQAQPKNQSRLELLRTSMLSPFRASGIRVRATPIYSAMTKHGPLVRNLLHIDIRDLEFEPQLDGSSKAHIDLLAVAVGAGDTPLAAIAKPFVVTVPQGGMERARRNGVVYSLDLAVKNPGPYQFRMAVRDRTTEKLGSASQYLEIPNLKRTPLALTSVVLGKGETADAGQHQLGLTPARRQFQQGEVLQYFCLLETGRKQHGAPKGELDAHVRVFHDDKEIYSGVAPMAKTPEGLPTVTGNLKLTGAIAPGEYYLQVTARSRDGKKENLAAQWTDFEVVD